MRFRSATCAFIVGLASLLSNISPALAGSEIVNARHDALTTKAESSEPFKR
jgi:hypothetical protein